MKSILEEIWYCNIDPQMEATRDNKVIKCFLLLKYFDKFDIIQTAYIAKNELLSEVL